MVPVLRLLESLGPSPESDERARAESVLLGRLSHGMPPEGEAEWDMARERFAPEAISDFEEWERLWERYRNHGLEPLGVVDLRARDADVALGIDEEDRLGADID